MTNEENEKDFVLPASAGMILMHKLNSIPWFGAPRIRGDDPG